MVTWGKPIPEKVVKEKNTGELAFVEMGDLMPEVWMREEEEVSVSRNVLTSSQMEDPEK